MDFADRRVAKALFVLGAAAAAASSAACADIFPEKFNPSDMPTMGGGLTGDTAASSGFSGGADPDVDVATDPENCGVIGYDCQGGSCVGGKCLPVVVGTGNQPYGVAVDDTHVYWTNYHGGDVRRGLKDGSGMDAELFTGVSGDLPIEIVADSAWVWFTVYSNVKDDDGKSLGRIGKAPKDLHEVKYPWTDLNGPWGITRAGDGVYWTNRFDTDLVVRALLPDGLTKTVASVAAGDPVQTPEPCGIAVDQTDIYWASRAAGTISRASIASGEPSVLWQKDGSVPFAIAVDEAALYWTGSGHANTTVADSIYRLEKSFGPPSEAKLVYQGHGAINHIALDGAFVYFTCYSTPDPADVPGANVGFVARVPKLGAGGGPAKAEKLAFGFNAPAGIALDDEAIYFASMFDDEVLKLAKPPAP